MPASGSEGRERRPSFIFPLPYYIFHLSLRLIATQAMTNEKCNMAKGKWYGYCDSRSGMQIAILKYL
jgi:hypothetical protein